VYVGLGLIAARARVLVHVVLDRGTQAVVRGGARCASQVLGRGAQAGARGAAQVLDRTGRCPRRRSLSVAGTLSWFQNRCLRRRASTWSWCPARCSRRPAGTWPRCPGRCSRRRSLCIAGTLSLRPAATRGTARCALQVLDRGAQAAARGGARCASQGCVNLSWCPAR
jgi:hypothetical protein